MDSAMSRLRLSSFLASTTLAGLALVAGCGNGTTGNGTDAATVDTGSPENDAGTPTEDSGRRDATVVDAWVPSDAGNDADVARCNYVGVDEVIVLCAGDYTFLSHFTSDQGCPDIYAFDPELAQYATPEEALAATPSCDATCQWHFSLAVDRMWCGHRSGYEILRSDAAGCADIYRFPEGYYASVEEHDAMVPCP